MIATRAFLPRPRIAVAAVLLVLALALAALAPHPASAARGAKATAPGQAAEALAQARAMAADWGRCPTARPANALLRRAERTRTPKERVRLAQRAVSAYEVVAQECMVPVDEPRVVLPPSGGPQAPSPGA